jgi:GNAT superfamily N-acetyltransferase
MDYSIRPAAEHDLDVLARFESAIARVSFGEDAVEDPEVHRRKLDRAMTKDPEGMFVAEAGGRVVGWLWLSMNTNFLTGALYGNFRSLAVDDDHHGTGLAELLVETGVGFACRKGATEIRGRVHVRNEAMRVVYRKFGFDAEHVIMRRKCGPDEERG